LVVPWLLKKLNVPEPDSGVLGVGAPPAQGVIDTKIGRSPDDASSAPTSP
jgi:hypothetical protein